jgi:hypothetical protein
MGLIVEIQAIGNQLFDLDLRGAFERPAASWPTAFTAVSTPIIASPVVAAILPVAIGRPVAALVTPIAAATLGTARRTIVAPGPVIPWFCVGGLLVRGLLVRGLLFRLRGLRDGSHSFCRCRLRSLRLYFFVHMNSYSCFCISSGFRRQSGPF